MSKQIDPKALEIGELELKCRDALQLDSIFKFLTEKQQVYEQLCALLDFIGDSEIALDSVSTHEKREKIEPYFLAYGLLQIMYARQISLKKVLDVLEAEVPTSLKDNSIIKPRDRIIGHFTTSDGEAHVILRNTLNADGFEYASYRGSQTKYGNRVEYEMLLEEHFHAIHEGLNALYRAIVRIENERRIKMRKEPLGLTLQGIEYTVNCLVGATVEDKYDRLVPFNIKSLKSTLGEFRKGYTKRYGEEKAAFHIDRILAGANMLSELYPFKNDDMRSRFEIIADGIRTNVKRLVEIAGETDKNESEEL